MSLSTAEREPPGLVRTQSIVLSGLYAWAATVLYPGSLRGAGAPARTAVSLAFVSLVVGAALGRKNTRYGRGFGLYGFVGLSVLSWALLGSLASVERLEPMRTALGAFGWILFAFSWGAPREPSEVPEDDPHALPGELLSPRGEVPAGAGWVLALATLGAAIPLLLAWRVTRSVHALLGHAVANVCAVALVTSGAEIAIGRGRWSPVEPLSRRLAQGAVPLVVLVVVLFVGVVGLFAG
jgi:hypothetical protein